MTVGAIRGQRSLASVASARRRFATVRLPWETRSPVTDSLPRRLREALQSQRAAGISFPEAWLVAQRLAHPDAAWGSALSATRDAWRDAYEGIPAPRAVTACAAVAFDPEREPIDDVRVCAGRRCDAVIPENRQNGARYCSTGCQRMAHGRTPVAA